MQNLFPGYYAPSDAQLRKLWTEGLIVLDANVLLNLYRYPETARQELLGLLNSVKSRRWVPYHVALEFQRNRLSVIAEQKRRFSEVKGLAEKTKSNFTGELNKLKLTERHALINPSDVVSQVSTAIDMFIAEIDQLEAHHLDVNKADKIRAALEEILDGRIGIAPTQEYVKRVTMEASERYASKMPPGYMDADKANASDPTFIYGGIRYENQYSDLIIWNQIMDFAKSSPEKYVMFITDDDKEDWWYRVTSSGDKTIGPRPELVEEAIRRGDLDMFHMFKSTGFLQQSKVFLQSQVSDATIEQIEAVARAKKPSDTVSTTESENAVNEWLRIQHPGWDMEETFLPDFKLVSPNGQETLGFEIVRANKVAETQELYDERISLLDGVRGQQYYARIDIIFVYPDEAQSIREAEKMCAEICKSGYGLILGHLDYSAGKPRFSPSLKLTS